MPPECARFLMVAHLPVASLAAVVMRERADDMLGRLIKEWLAVLDAVVVAQPRSWADVYAMTVSAKCCADRERPTSKKPPKMDVRSVTCALAARVDGAVSGVTFEQHMGGNCIRRCSKCHFMIACAGVCVANFTLRRGRVPEVAIGQLPRGH
jgi:hypothetical protein